MSTALGVLAAAWAMIMALSPLLQVREITRRRSSAGISIGYFRVLLVGFALWVAYGVASGDVPLVVPNSVALVVMAFTIVVVLRRRSRGPDGLLESLPMTVRFNHMMVAARDRNASARFFAEMFGLSQPEDSGMFSIVRLAGEEMLLFAEPGIDFPGQHYAFLIDDDTFDRLLTLLHDRNVPYQGDPRGRLQNQINTDHGGRGVYFDDPSGHHLEALTRSYGGAQAG